MGRTPSQTYAEGAEAAIHLRCEDGALLKSDSVLAMRIAVLGTSGSGKTTFARRLAGALEIAHVELDAVNWQAGWRDLNTHEPQEFRRRVEEAAGADAWVMDGNYSRVRDLVLARATHMVWLDYPRSVIMRRVIWRSFFRAMTKSELWPGTGNREEFRKWLSPEHPIRWAWDTWDARRARYASLFADPSLAGLERLRLERPNQAEALIELLRREEKASIADCSDTNGRTPTYR